MFIPRPQAFIRQPTPRLSYTDYTPPGPWADGQPVTRNYDGVGFIYSATLNTLSVVPNQSASVKDANSHKIINLPDPTSSLDAANKEYVDAHSGGGGGGISDAPSDGTYYGRMNAAWANVAPLNSPTLTGTPAAPTPTAGTNTTQIATTAFVETAVAGVTVPAPSTSIPGMDGTGSAGVAVTYSRGDHVHPSDTTKAPLASPALTGTPTAPTPATGDNSTTLATTAFVKTQGYLTGNQTVTLSGDITGSGTTAIPTTLATVNSNVGTFQGITVNAKGLVTAAVNQGYISGNQNITLSGDATGSGTTAIAVTFATVNSNVGTFQGITVNGKGLVTGAVDMSYAPLASPTFTGTPAAPTATAGTSTTQLATTQFVGNAISAISSGVISIGGVTGAILLNASDLAISSSTLQLAAARKTGCTVTVKTSGSGSYTPPTGCTRLEVILQGGSGGGGASGTAGWGTATAGGTTSFGTSLFQATGSTAANQFTAGTPGAGSGGYLNLTGGTGQPGIALNSVPGGSGGVSRFGGQGWGGTQGGTAGSAATVNTGSGAGGGGAYTASGQSGAGSCAGGYCEGIVNNPTGSYNWAVGAGGTGQSAGTSGYAGGAGVAGILIIKEYYN